MKLLVLAATAFEIQPFRSLYPDADVCISGIGSTHTTYALLKELHKKKYDTVVQCGVAGTMDEALPVGSAVWVQRDYFADWGVYEQAGFQSVFDLGLAKQQAFPFSDGWLPNPHVFDLPAHLPTVSGASVNILTDNQPLIQQLYQTTQPQIESMEGAAFHYVCLMENIKFLQIRGISNRVGERDKSTWKLNEAIQSSNEVLINLYQKRNS